jgi:hypothetical protein
MTDQSLMSGTAPVAWQQLTAHPLAEMFPLMSEDELAALTADIKENGLQEAIDLYEGQIVDGRNRHAACLRCGIEPRFVEYRGDDPLGFIISKNLHRRHLSQAAKGEIVIKILTEHPKWADRAIGRLARVDGKTVAARRAELEASAEIPHFETREDKKGHRRPAHKAPASAPGVKRAGRSGPLLHEERDAKTAVAFLERLHDGNIHEHLDGLVRMLGHEKERISALPKIERESLASRFLDVLDIDLDDLRPRVGVPPAFEGSIH